MVPPCLCGPPTSAVARSPTQACSPRPQHVLMSLLFYLKAFGKHQHFLPSFQMKKQKWKELTQSHGGLGERVFQGPPGPGSRRSYSPRQRTLGSTWAPRASRVRLRLLLTPTQGWPGPAARRVTQADRSQTGSYLRKTTGCTRPLGWTLVPTQPQLPLLPHAFTPPDTALTKPCVSGTAAGKVFDTQREKGG